MKRRILFYLEPVTYADSPLRLGGWWNISSALAVQSATSSISAVAASPAICSLASPGFEAVYPLGQNELLKTANFDRVAYSRDLCRGFRYPNRALLRALQKIKATFQPDVVLSVTDNRYLKKVFGSHRVIFMELGPLPRTGMDVSIFFDPFGHQMRSAPNWFARSKWEHPKLGEFSALWEEKWLTPMRQRADSMGIFAWLDATIGRESPKIMLAALQPRDWITYEGIGPSIDPLSLLRRLANDMNDEWVIIPQWHASDALPCDDMITELESDNPNILIPPSDLRMSNSEFFIPFTNAVTTISSNVAALGVILGKGLRFFGKSKFQSFGRKRALKGPRPDILAFLGCKYCLRLENALNTEGLFSEHIERIQKYPLSLFDPTGINPDQLQQFFVDAPVKENREIRLAG